MKRPRLFLNLAFWRERKRKRRRTKKAIKEIKIKAIHEKKRKKKYNEKVMRIVKIINR